MFFTQRPSYYAQKGKNKLVTDLAIARVEKVLQFIKPSYLFSEGKSGLENPYIPKVTILFDGANFNKTLNDLGLDCNYLSLFDFFRNRFDVTSIYYFVALSPDKRFNKLRRTLRWMETEDIRVRTKESIPHIDEYGKRIWKGNMDGEIHTTCLSECIHNNVFIFFTGDGDFLSLIQNLKQRRRKVIVCSHHGLQGGDMSSKLRQNVNGYIDVQDLFMTIDYDIHKKLRQESFQCPKNIRSNILT